MTESEPITAQSISAYDETVTSWAEARQGLAEARTYWLATVRPDGQPHVRPHLAVWVDDALYFSSSPTSRKGKNLDHDAHCSVPTHSRGLDLVVEGTAVRVTDEASLQRVADAYAAKYEWPVTVRDGAFVAEYGAPTAGPPPYHVFEVTPSTIFGFGEGPATRWRFAPERRS
ncbi:MAG: pyridoxamine 5'-phosphate oxidase family protein [Chloroflexia bacterium]|nr:pyridoxamine 5'-phosphate oxidase family protein [Chloroflexia bacterium]